MGAHTAAPWQHSAVGVCDLQTQISGLIKVSSERELPPCVMSLADSGLEARSKDRSNSNTVMRRTHNKKKLLRRTSYNFFLWRTIFWLFLFSYTLLYLHKFSLEKWAWFPSHSQPFLLDLVQQEETGVHMMIHTGVNGLFFSVKLTMVIHRCFLMTLVWLSSCFDSGIGCVPFQKHLEVVSIVHIGTNTLYWRGTGLGWLGRFKMSLRKLAVVVLFPGWWPSLPVGVLTFTVKVQIYSH